MRAKFDLGDVDEIGWTGADILKVLNSPALTETVYERPREQFSWKDDIKSNESFECDDSGVFFIAPSEPGEELKKHRICSPIRIVAAVRDADGVNWGRSLLVQDPLGNWHKHTMPMSELKGSGEEVRGVLLGLGAELEPGVRNKNLLMTYLQVAKPKEMARCVSKIGWHDRVFVFPEETFGNLNSEKVYFQTEGECKHGLKQKGTLDDWTAHVASICVGNSRLMFALCVALAAPLFHLVDEENGGFHFRGSSSIGKSTALFLSASVYGGKDFICTWRSTSNGMEATAVAHNDIVLLLDELGQVDPAQAGEVAYLLGNSQTKQRAGRSGSARRTLSFRSLFLSTGEIGLADHMAVAGRKSNAGQEVRVIDIPADAGAGLGLFENLHGTANGDEFARSIKESTEKYHGTAAVAFIQKLVAADVSLPSLIRGIRDAFVKEVLQEPASGQARRVAGRFGLVAVAGELATRYGITGWKEGAAAEAVAQCFNAWLEARGGPGSIEPKAILSQVRFFFEQHGESRFSSFKEEPDRVTMHRAGFKKLDDTGNKLEFFVLPETFKNEVCKGLDARGVARLLVEKGWLVPGSDGKSTRVERLPGVGRLRCYRFTSKVLGDGD